MRKRRYGRKSRSRYGMKRRAGKTRKNPNRAIKMRPGKIGFRL